MIERDTYAFLHFCEDKEFDDVSTSVSKRGSYNTHKDWMRYACHELARKAWFMAMINYYFNRVGYENN